ncbi:MAG: hypothetical protein GXN97_04545 [Aquificae bacterium]|nr:hypothetical protein [Aquificota bacterium]
MAVELTKGNLLDILAERSGIDKKTLRRILILLEFSLRKKDGSPTSFAEKFGIKTFDDLYNFFKHVKEDFKRDHEQHGFNDLTELWKSVAARTQYWIMSTFGEENERDALFAASVFVMRTLGMLLDNLLLLKKIIKTLDEYQKVVSEFVAEQKFQAEDKE